MLPVGAHIGRIGPVRVHRHPELVPFGRAHDVAAGRSRTETVADAELEQRLAHGIDQPSSERRVPRAGDHPCIEPDPDAVVGHDRDVECFGQARLVVGVHRRQSCGAPCQRQASPQRLQRDRVGFVLADGTLRGRRSAGEALERRDLPAGSELDAPPQHLVEHLGPRCRLVAAAFRMQPFERDQQVRAHPARGCVRDHGGAPMSRVPQGVEAVWHRRRQQLCVRQLIDAPFGHHIERRQVVQAGVDVADRRHLVVAHCQIFDQRAGRQRHVGLSEAAVDDALKVQGVDADNHVCDRMGAAAFEQIDDIVGRVFSEHHDLDAGLFGEGFQRLSRQVKVAVGQDAHRGGTLFAASASRRHDRNRAHRSEKARQSARPVTGAACHGSESPARCPIGR